MTGGRVSSAVTGSGSGDIVRIAVTNSTVLPLDGTHRPQNYLMQLSKYTFITLRYKVPFKKYLKYLISFNKLRLPPQITFGYTFSNYLNGPLCRMRAPSPILIPIHMDMTEYYVCKMWYGCHYHTQIEL